MGLEISSSIRLKKLSGLEGEQLLKAEINKVNKFPRESMAALSDVSGSSLLNMRLLPVRVRTIGYIRAGIKSLYRKCRKFFYE